MDSFARGLVLALALGLVPTAAACNKDKDKEKDKSEEKSSKKGDKEKADKSDDDDKPGKKKKKGDDDDKASAKDDSKKGDDDDKGSKKKGDDDSSGDSSEYTAGEVLKHVPSSCKQGHMYFDLQALLKNEAVRANSATLDEKLTEAMKGDDGKKAEAFVKALRKQGINPMKDLRDVAVCMGAKDEMLAVFGGNLGGKKVLEKVKKASEEADKDSDLKEGEADGVSYLSSKDKKGKTMYFGLVAPNVVAMSEDKAAFAALKKSSDRTEEWGAGKGRIFAATVDTGKEGMVDMFLTNKGDDLEAKFSMKLPANQAKAAKKDPKNFKKGFEQGIGGAMEALEKTPAKAIAPDLKDMKIDIDDDGKVTVTANIKNEHLAQVLKKVSESSESDLEGLMK